MKRALIAGPCISEFGWEVMEWQGYVRQQSQGCDWVIVCSRPHMQPLYADIESSVPLFSFIPHRIDCVVTDHRAHEIRNQDEYDAAIKTLDSLEHQLTQQCYEVTRLNLPHPNNRFAEKFADHGLQTFVKYGKRTPRIIIHARNKAFVENSERNYPPELWTEIVAGLLRYGPVAAIGTHAEALCPEGCEDYRGLAINDLCDLLANADVIVGPSSGPMHLASLCVCPHVVWTEKESTRIRYEASWNPHKTKCKVLIQPGDGWILPRQVLQAVRGMIGRKSEPQKRGVIYVVSGESWPAVFERSVTSLRMHYAGPVAVLCDSEYPDLAAVCDMHSVEMIPVACPGPTPQTNSRYMKTQVSRFTPYQQSLFIDCDTVIMRPIDDVWSLLDTGRNVWMIPESCCPTVGERDYRNNPQEGPDTIGLCGEGSTHWHSSTILFASTPDAQALFRVWHREWAKYGINPKRQRIQDQPALARAAYLTGCNIGLLPKRYNTRRDCRGRDQITTETVIYSEPASTGDYFAAYERVIGISAANAGASIPACIYRRPGRKVRRKGDKC